MFDSLDGDWDVWFEQRSVGRFSLDFCCFGEVGLLLLFESEFTLLSEVGWKVGV